MYFYPVVLHPQRGQVKVLYTTQGSPCSGSVVLMTEAVEKSLKRLRIEQGWALSQAAEQVGVTATALSRIERGLAVPRPSTIKALADAFELTTSEILDSLEPHQRP